MEPSTATSGSPQQMRQRTMDLTMGGGPHESRAHSVAAEVICASALCYGSEGGLQALTGVPIQRRQKLREALGHGQLLITSRTGNLRQILRPSRIAFPYCVSSYQAVLSTLAVMRACPTPGVQSARNGERPCPASQRKRIVSPSALTGNVRRF